MAQDFFAAFGQDGVGQIGTETTINSGDLAGILMIAVQALEKRTAELKQKEAADCCTGIAAGSAGVATESVYADNSREVVTIHRDSFSEGLFAHNPDGAFSSRRPAKLEWRKCPSGVHSVNSTGATRSGFSQRHSFRFLL